MEDRDTAWSCPIQTRLKARLCRLQGQSFAVFTGLTVSGVVCLALKIVAAGVYRPSFSPKASHIVLDTDLTPIFGFEDFAGLIPQAIARSWATANTEFVSARLQPNFNNPQGQYAVGDLVTPFVMENLTNYLDADGSRDFYASRITMESFAVQTNVTCIGFDQPEFALTLDCRENGSYSFTFDCLSQVCHQNFDNLLSQINVSYVYDHTSHEPRDAFSMAASPDRNDASLAVLLADFSNLTGHHPEMPSFCSSDGPRTLTSTDLGSSYPTIRGVNCMRVMNKVNVTTTMQPAPPGIPLAFFEEAQMSWWTTGYDEGSLKVFSKVNPSPWPHILLSNSGAPVVHQGATVSPLIDFFNILSLIAQAQDTVTGNQKDLLDVDNLVSAAQKVYALESRELLSFVLAIIQFKTIPGMPLGQFPPRRTMKAAATAFTYREHVFQDSGTTIALLSLLTVVLACVVFMSLATPRKTILPTAPSSITAQMSFVAGSVLVQRLREENAATTKDSRVWDEVFGLGWWPQRRSSPAAEENIDSPNGDGTMRWGIDVGLLPDKRDVLPNQRPTTGGGPRQSQPGLLPDDGHVLPHQSPTTGGEPLPSQPGLLSDDGHVLPRQRQTTEGGPLPSDSGLLTDEGQILPHARPSGDEPHRPTSGYYTPLKLSDLGHFENDFVNEVVLRLE